jgi:hypothetical protein
LCKLFWSHRRTRHKKAITISTMFSTSVSRSCRAITSGCGKLSRSINVQVSFLNGQHQQRFKHSARQVKRLFKNHPARKRIEARQGITREPEPLSDPKFEAIHEPTFLRNGWSAPPPAEIQVPQYPFKVARTKNKPNDAIGFLPVYSEFR